MNAADADELLTQAIEQREEAARYLTRFNTDVERAETALHVATTNRDTAQRHFDATVARVALTERVLRELTIADDGGHRPDGSQ
jgi:hypothetical protein